MAADISSKKMEVRTHEDVHLRSARPSASDSCPFLGGPSFLPGGPNTRYSEVTQSTGERSPDICTPPLKAQPPSSMPPGLRSLLHKPLRDIGVGGNMQKTLLSSPLDAHVVLSSQNPLFGRSPSPVSLVCQQPLSLPARAMQQFNIGALPGQIDGLNLISQLQTPSSNEDIGEQRLQSSPSRAATGYIGDSHSLGAPENEELCQFASPWPGAAGVQGDSGRNELLCQQLPVNTWPEDEALQLTFSERLEMARSGISEASPSGAAAEPPIAFGSVEASFRTPSEEDLPLAEAYSPATAEEGGGGTNSRLQPAVAGVEELQDFAERLRDKSAAIAIQDEAEATAALVRGSGIGRYRMSEAGDCGTLRAAETDGMSSVMGELSSEHMADAHADRAWGHSVSGVCPKDGMQAIVSRILGNNDSLSVQSVLPRSKPRLHAEESFTIQEAYWEEEDLDDWVWEDVLYRSHEVRLSLQPSGMEESCSEPQKGNMAHRLATIARKPDSRLRDFIHCLFKQLNSVADSLWLPVKSTAEQAKVPPMSVAAGAVMSFVLTVLLCRHLSKQRKIQARTTHLSKIH